MEKQLLSIPYLDDNSFNLSYIYRFNILADNGYFPDKSMEILEKHYNLEGNYQIPLDERKNFVKQISYGRLNVMLDNTDYMPNEDQLVGCNKVRNTFSYLG